jgi:hypothetical protein
LITATDLKDAAGKVAEIAKFEANI